MASRNGEGAGVCIREFRKIEQATATIVLIIFPPGHISLLVRGASAMKSALPEREKR
jgi:hypothetical protein